MSFWYESFAQAGFVDVVLIALITFLAFYALGLEKRIIKLEKGMKQ